MFDNKIYFNNKGSTEKSFGYVFSIFFLLLGIYFLYFKNTFLIWTFLLSFIFLSLALFFPKILTFSKRRYSRKTERSGLKNQIYVEGE